MMKISFCIITLNEETNLGRCLDSVADLADEIVVLDSGSSDGTETIARKHDAVWKHQDWLGFVGQKNKLLGLATHDWVFSIDADEELSPELRREVAALKQTVPDVATGPNAVVGWSMPRCVLYEGKWIRHGDWYPDRLTRLFRRSWAKFAGAKVHERLELEGSVTPLRGELYHYSFKDAEDHWNRCRKYAALWAESQLEQGRRVGPLSPLAHACFRWVRCYLLKRGFLDGGQGWRIAKMNAREVYLKYSLLRQAADSR